MPHVSRLLARRRNGPRLLLVPCCMYDSNLSWLLGTQEVHMHLAAVPKTTTPDQ
jgi:hypothetical protein